MTDIDLNNNIFGSIDTHIYSLPYFKGYLNHFKQGMGSENYSI